MWKLHILLTNSFLHKFLICDIIKYGDNMTKRKKRVKKSFKLLMTFILVLVIIFGGYFVYNNFFKDDSKPVSSEIEKLMQEANISKEFGKMVFFY